MAQKPRELTPHLSARHFFGAELRHWRTLRRLSQNQLGKIVHISGDEVGKVEKAERWPTLALARAWDAALRTGDELARIFPLVEHERRAALEARDHDAVPVLDVSDDYTAQAIPHQSTMLAFPIVGGRAMPGVQLSARLHYLRPAGRALFATMQPVTGAPVTPELVVATDPTGTVYLLDPRGVRRRHNDGRAVVPDAYRLDSFTYAIMWAVANLDAALLADDRRMAETRRHLRVYQELPHSAVAREEAGDLSAVAQMWVGSEFCSRHILGCLGPGVPQFWTREQRGEEACTWLLFGHKYAYLRDTAVRGIDGPMTRGFCIPESVVRDSPEHERILLFLSAALMESLGIRTIVCPDPDLDAVEGFVLMPTGRAIIANWVRGDGIWHVGSVDDRKSLRSFEDVLRHARARSILGHDDPRSRLIHFADYLGLRWDWLTERCREIAEHGSEGIMIPRSRLLSARAVDDACAFVGGLR